MILVKKEVEEIIEEETIIEKETIIEEEIIEEEFDEERDEKLNEDKHALENQIKKVLYGLYGKERENFHIVIDHTSSNNNLDLKVKINGKYFWIECKQRNTLYSKEWVKITGIPRNNLFAFDELGINKAFCVYPKFMMIVLDTIENRYYLFNPYDIQVMDKVRLNRPVQKANGVYYKGKWVIDLSKWGYEVKNIDEALRETYYFAVNEQNYKTALLEKAECYNTEKYNVPCLSDKTLRTTEDYVKCLSENMK